MRAGYPAAAPGLVQIRPKPATRPREVAPSSTSRRRSSGVPGARARLRALLATHTAPSSSTATALGLFPIGSESTDRDAPWMDAPQPCARFADEPHGVAADRDRGGPRLGHLAPPTCFRARVPCASRASSRRRGLRARRRRGRLRSTTRPRGRPRAACGLPVVRIDPRELAPRLAREPRRRRRRRRA